VALPLNTASKTAQCTSECVTAKVQPKQLRGRTVMNKNEALKLALKNLLVATKHLGVCPGTVQVAEEALAQPEQPSKEPETWFKGPPPFPQNQEWFIAKTIHRERVVLKVLPEEYKYDYTTGDGTYMMASNITHWMQFPDCQFLPPAGQALAQPEREPVAWNKPELGTLKHSDNCRYWDENISCTCGAIEYTGLQFWKNKVLVQPDRIPDAGKTIGAESTKREWVGLTQHQIAEVGFEMLPDVPQKDFLAFARYIEVLSKGAIK